MTTAWDRRTDTPLVCGGHQTLETVLFQLRSLYSCGGESHGLRGELVKEGSCPLTQQERECETAKPKYFTTNEHKSVHVIKHAEWASSSLSQHNFATFVANLFNYSIACRILLFGPVRPPPPKKTRGGAHFNASVPGAENPSYATVVFMSMFMFSCFSFLRNLLMNTLEPLCTHIFKFLMNTFEPLARISSSWYIPQSL